jgi:alanine racemase
VHRNAPLPCLHYSLDDLLHNCSVLRKRLPPGVGILAVVKDRAYGCGSAPVAGALERHCGVRYFGVNNPDEAFFLRRNGIKGDILVLGPASPAAIRKGARSGILFTLNDLSDIALWKKTGVSVRFHCNVDTRMHRMGILPSEVPEAIHRIVQNPDLKLEGVFTHFANAHEIASTTVPEQIRLLKIAISQFAKAGIPPIHVHYANSAAINGFPLKGSTLVRPGIELYGCRPDPALEVPLDLKPIVTLKTSIIKIKRVPAGTPVSYGGRYVTKRETCIATIALGYGCGYPRSLGNRGHLLIGGRRYRICGTVSMDFCMVDAGLTPAFKVGDEVVAIGRQGNELITPDDVALLNHTIGYEILCRLGTALDRTYFFKGRVVGREKGYIY